MGVLKRLWLAFLSPILGSFNNIKEHPQGVPTVLEYTLLSGRSMFLPSHLLYSGGKYVLTHKCTNEFIFTQRVKGRRHRKSKCPGRNGLCCEIEKYLF